MDLANNSILEKMLDRLFASLVNGPSLNARPHSSRQRIDFMQFGKMKDRNLEDVLRDLLGEQREARIMGRVPPPPKPPAREADGSSPPITPEIEAAQKAYAEQQAVLNKCRGIAEDAKVYENDTGVHVLQIGFPILSLPPGSFSRKGFTRRVSAPVCFTSLSMIVRGVPNPVIALECRNEGADLVMPNAALLSWLEVQSGREAGDLEADEAGEHPWDEIAAVIGRVAHLLGIDVPENFSTGETLAASLSLKACPRSDDDDTRPTILSSAVVGLFPASNQGLIRDTQALLAGEPAVGPIENFVNASVRLETADTQPADENPGPVERRTHAFGDERLITYADPCQARAVRLARQSRGLVVHGPPGTGKSQTIANIIGDHLARGERVLFVCDKRTALDVVMNRLESMGISGLCAVVHDPQRDQRDLYRAIREQLDNLADLRTRTAVERQLERLDAELQDLHHRLTEYHQALMQRPGGEAASFHELVGQWLTLPTYSVELKEDSLTGVTSGDLDARIQALSELFQRGLACAYANNPWVQAAGLALAEFLATPMDAVRRRVQLCADRGSALNDTPGAHIPPFQPGEDVIKAGEARATLAAELAQLAQQDRARLATWSQAAPPLVQQQARKLDELARQAEIIKSNPLETELMAALGGALPTVAVLNQQIVGLEQYVQSARSFLGFLAFGKKKRAAQALATFGLSLSPENAARVHAFLLGLKARVLVQELVSSLVGPPAGGALDADERLVTTLAEHERLFATLITVATDPHLQPLRAMMVAAVASKEALEHFIEGLRLSPARARAIADFEKTLSEAGLFSRPWLAATSESIRASENIAVPMATLQERLSSLENVLRIREALPALPDPLRRSVEQLLGQSVEPEVGLTVLRKAALFLEITGRLRTDPRLQSTDSHGIQSSFERYVALQEQKQSAVRELILHVWGTRQKDRLLASTGSRLNGVGADLRRRFVLRGERAMRLRQVIAVGQSHEENDPLFDLRPVWMASPETVAQIFPRKPLFDAIVFDEASQCRLEEALPVLLRGKRVVIAGDPKQLPPTRFFESAIAVSDQDEIETDQQLFESQQGEIEDLLGAALNIEIDECYLDVHYRSRNSDLIEFSNQHFYSSRLQPIPAHPSNRSRFAPLTLYRVNGTYQDRQNEAEADRVARIVRDLLKRAAPPSIGIACFNINQRDLILEKLEELAETDSAFSRALSAAWTRRTDGQFEGLFVKNLENVQGDERDHMIISTTYGPDEKGRFYRRFGPLGRAGGGRRLNVLVTRARHEVHLVTSIPESEYRHLPPVPPGQTPGGGWLLFSYLHYAEILAEAYEQAHQTLTGALAAHQPRLEVRPTRYPSPFCRGLGEHLVEARQTGAEVYWGNDGFCVDLALLHPRRAADVTIGILCDTNRFGLAADPVEWEIFRTLVLESQGWKLHRLWTPHFFRDVRGHLDAIAKNVQQFLAGETEKDACRVNEPDDLTGP